MANDALRVNPVQGARHLTRNGSSWLWAVFAIFLLAFLLHAAIAVLKGHSKTRGPTTTASYLPTIFTLALFAGTLAYFAQAAGLGSYAIRTSHNVARYASYQVFWPKYAYWAVSFAAVVLTLGLLTRSSWARIFFGVGLSWAWVFSYFLSSQTGTRYKWGFFALGTLAWLGLALVTFGMKGSKNRTGAHVDGTHNTTANTGVTGVTGTNNTTTTTGHNTGANGAKTATGLIAYANLLWLMYPIAYGISDGGNRIGVTGAFIFFGILDLLLLPVIAGAALFHAKKNGVPHRGHFGEKHGYNNGYNNNGLTGTHNGVGHTGPLGTHHGTTHPAGTHAVV